jgi:hypothetical protein
VKIHTTSLTAHAPVATIRLSEGTDLILVMPTPGPKAFSSEWCKCSRPLPSSYRRRCPSIDALCGAD